MDVELGRYVIAWEPMEKGWADRLTWRRAPEVAPFLVTGDDLRRLACGEPVDRTDDQLVEGILYTAADWSPFYPAGATPNLFLRDVIRHFADDAASGDLESYVVDRTCAVVRRDGHVLAVRMLQGAAELFPWSLRIAGNVALDAWYALLEGEPIAADEVWRLVEAAWAGMDFDWGYREKPEPAEVLDLAFVVAAAHLGGGAAAFDRRVRDALGRLTRPRALQAARDALAHAPIPLSDLRAWARRERRGLVPTLLRA